MAHSPKALGRTAGSRAGCSRCWRSRSHSPCARTAGAYRRHRRMEGSARCLGSRSGGHWNPGAPGPSEAARTGAGPRAADQASRERGHPVSPGLGARRSQRRWRVSALLSNSELILPPPGRGKAADCSLSVAITHRHLSVAYRRTSERFWPLAKTYRRLSSTYRWLPESRRRLSITHRRFALSTLARKFGHVFVRRPVGGRGRSLVGVVWPSHGV